MDNAVALVRSYLQVNGYFTVCEYPVLERTHAHGFQTATDFDVLAFRFAHAGQLVPAPDGNPWHTRYVLDETLGVNPDESDMIIGEVKEGRAQLNKRATDPSILEAALARFGCCRPGEAPHVVKRLLEKGYVTSPTSHRLRLVVFASDLPSSHKQGIRMISLGHIVSFLNTYIATYWDVLRRTQVKDPGLGFLMTLYKARLHAEATPINPPLPANPTVP